MRGVRGVLRHAVLLVKCVECGADYKCTSYAGIFDHKCTPSQTSSSSSARRTSTGIEVYRYEKFLQRESRDVKRDEKEKRYPRAVRKEKRHRAVWKPDEKFLVFKNQEKAKKFLKKEAEEFLKNEKSSKFLKSEKFLKAEKFLKFLRDAVVLDDD